MTTTHAPSSPLARASGPKLTAKVLDLAARVQRASDELTAVAVPVMGSDLGAVERLALTAKAGLTQAAPALFRLAEALRTAPTAADQTADELARTVRYLASETHRFESEVCGDVEVTLLPTGEAPHAALCKVVRDEREHLRAFRRVVERHATRLRGAR